MIVNARKASRLGRVRRGLTLIEIVIVIAIIGMSAGIAGLATRSVSASNMSETPAAAVARARVRATESGVAVTLLLRLPQGLQEIRVRPDGTVSGAESIGVERLSGRPRPSVGREQGHAY